MAAPRAHPLYGRMGAPHDLGRRGESLAASLLMREGWIVLARNFRFGHKEIDLVARRGAQVAFVEVKTRAGSGYGHPLVAITWSKRRELGLAARAWISRNGRTGDLYRFDAISVYWPRLGSPVIEHVENAWTLY